MSTITEALAAVCKGDVPGHEFHGNQYSNSQGGKDHAGNTPKARKLIARFDRGGNFADNAYEYAHEDAKNLHGLSDAEAEHFLNHVRSATQSNAVANFNHAGGDEESRKHMAQEAVHRQKALEYLKAGKPGLAKRQGEAANLHFLSRTGKTDPAQIADMRASAWAASGRLKKDSPTLGSVHVPTTNWKRKKKKMRKGDVPGHEFHGNQFTSGGSASGDKSPHDRQYKGNERTSDVHDALASGKSFKVLRDKNTIYQVSQPHENGIDVRLPKGHAITYYPRISGESMGQFHERAARLLTSTYGLNTEIKKGDTPGHEFHGNQYSNATAGKAMKYHEKMVGKHNTAADDARLSIDEGAGNRDKLLRLARKHDQAAEAHKGAYFAHATVQENMAESGGKPTSGDLRFLSRMSNRATKMSTKLGIKKGHNVNAETIWKMLGAALGVVKAEDYADLKDDNNDEEECDEDMEDQEEEDDLDDEGEDFGNKNLKIDAVFKELDHEKQIAYGWASVVEKDGQLVFDAEGDAIDETELVAMAHRFVSDVRKGKLGHAGNYKTQLVESMVFTKDLQKTLGIELNHVGWLTGWHIPDKKDWERVKSGELSALSIGGSGVRTPVAA